jgi:hypothetical protein
MDEKSTTAVPTAAQWQKYRDEKHKSSIAYVLEEMTKSLIEAIRNTHVDDVALWLPWPDVRDAMKYTDPAMRRAVNQHFEAAGWDVRWSDERTTFASVTLRPRDGSNSIVSTTTGAAADAAADT